MFFTVISMRGKNVLKKRGGERMETNLVVTIVGLAASLSSIVFALLAFKRSEKQEHKTEGKSEGLILSDVGYIKACVDRMEKNLTSVDERYRNVLERLAKVEESLANARKMVDEIKKEGG